MVKIGLKLWSSNKTYIGPARALYARGVFDYVELFTVPGNGEMVKAWRDLEVPYVLHAPHSLVGFNPSLKEKEQDNRNILKEVDKYVAALMPEHIIFHLGIGGELAETIRQLEAFKVLYPSMFKKALIENKPKVSLTGEVCLGTSPEEIRYVLERTNFGFCLDFVHAVCYSVWAKTECQHLIDEFMQFKPTMFHLCDGRYDEKDGHYHFGGGELDLGAIVRKLPLGSRVTLETPKDFPDRLDDFEKDVEAFKRYASHQN
jgi:deoxyribonuclease IV